MNRCHPIPSRIPLGHSLTVFAGAAACLLLSSCLTYMSGSSKAKRPEAFRAKPPSVAFVLGSGVGSMDSDLRYAVANSEYLDNSDADGSDAHVVVTVEHQIKRKVSPLVYVNIFLLGILPLPVESNESVLLARMRVGSLEEVALPPVARKVHTWGGLLLLPLSFIQHNDSKSQGAMARDVVMHVAREYAELHDRTWQAVKTQNRAGGLEEFLAAFPNSDHAGGADQQLESKLFAKTQQSQTAAAYLHYLRLFPHSERAAEVRQRGAEPAWRDLSQYPEEERLEEYLQAFSGSPTAAQAEAALAGLLWDAASEQTDTADPYRALLDRFPAGPRAEHCRDVLAWADVEDSRTPGSIRAYLEKYPTGQFRAKAQSVLKLYGDPRLQQAAAGVPQIVDSIARSQFGTLPNASSAATAEVGGTLHFKGPDVLLALEYDAKYSHGRLSSYLVESGTITLKGDRFELAADGVYYPAFDRRFLAAE